MIDSSLLCKKHLIGEHGEMHKFIPSFRKGHRVDGRFDPIVQIQFQGYIERHDAIVSEMTVRGFNHKSPMVDIPDFKKIYPQHFNKLVDVNVSYKDLIDRCPDCKKRITEYIRGV